MPRRQCGERWSGVALVASSRALLAGQRSGALSAIRRFGRTSLCEPPPTLAIADGTRAARTGPQRIRTSRAIRAIIRRDDCTRNGDLHGPDWQAAGCVLDSDARRQRPRPPHPAPVLARRPDAAGHRLARWTGE